LFPDQFTYHSEKLQNTLRLCTIEKSKRLSHLNKNVSRLWVNCFAFLQHTLRFLPDQMVRLVRFIPDPKNDPGPEPNPNM